ncbi:arylsulfatase [Flavobacteriaceae bacterium MHTCC 0001]
MSCSSNDNEISTDQDASKDDTNNSTPNILLIIADDMGIDATSGYVLGNEKKPNTPNIEALMQNGIKYTNVWSAPLCTPTRGGMITGKYGFRTGVTMVGDALDTSETTLQEHIRQSSNYETAVIGKWHLGSRNDEMHPNNAGVGYYAGYLSGAVTSYTNWNLTINGVTTTETSYVTSKYTDLAIDWIKAQDDKPWFLWLAHNAPHDPYEYPPESLYETNGLPPVDADFTEDHRKFFAMIEAMDKEIGRLLDSMDEITRNNTTIIFVGDNGTGGSVSQVYNSRRAKGSVFQGGVNVPMVISGKGVSRQNATDHSLISTVDLYATITEIINETPPSDSNDSVSFASTFNGNNTNARSFVFTEIENNDGTFNRAIRNATHKYISVEDDKEEYLYNLSSNPLENPNLLSSNQAPLSTDNENELNTLLAEKDRILQNQ